MEDVGLKSAADNIVQDPGITGFRSEWLDAHSRHLLGNYVKPPGDAANAIRAAAGLPTLAPSDLEKEESEGDSTGAKKTPDTFLAMYCRHICSASSSFSFSFAAVFPRRREW